MKTKKREEKAEKNSKGFFRNLLSTRTKSLPSFVVMASKSASVGGVLRREVTLARYDPYAATGNKYDDMKEVAIRLGIDLSLCVAESMYLLCDDMKNMLLFCCMIFRVVKPEENPVSERLLRVMHHVYTNDIIPNNRVHQDKICPNLVHCGLIGSAWKDFAYGIRFLHRLVMLLRRNGGDHRIATLDTADCKRQMLKKLEDKLRSAKDASEANGFSRETTESNISEMWKSLFDEEEEEADAGRAKATKTRLLCNLFKPLFGESWQPNWGRHNEVFTPLPLYTIGKDFAKQERLREEAVRLGVELSLYVAESMFLLCDDIRSVLVFCNMLWGAVEKDLNQPHDSPVVEGLLRVFHYVYSKHIKPKSGVFQNGGTSVHWKMAMTFFEDFHAAIRGLGVFLREGNRPPECSIEEPLKKVEEKLRFAKAVSEANGFAWDAMESEILVIWKSLFDKPTEDLWALKMMRLGILNDLFRPLVKERAEAKH